MVVQADDYEEGAALRALSELASHTTAAPEDPAEIARLQAQLASMQAESQRLQAVLELEEMKAQLLGLNAPAAAPLVREAWGDDIAQEENPETLNAADEERIAKLLAENDGLDDDAFEAQSPSEMLATLEGMEAQLAQLKAVRDAQQDAELDRLKALLASEKDSLAEEKQMLERLRLDQ